ncbi:MAG: hypothetical protein WBV82_11295 [Myxococcaceae bacterium]
MRKAAIALSLVMVAALPLACTPGGREVNEAGDAGGVADAGARVPSAGGDGGETTDGGVVAGAEHAWLDDDATWREVPGASSIEARVLVREAVPGALRFPRIQWESCGPSCEVAMMDQSHGEIWYAAMDTVVTPTGPRVWTSFLLPGNGYTMRRFIDLGTGETVAALRIEPSPRNASQFPDITNAGKSPLALSLFADPTSENGNMVRALYDARSGAWEFKLPWEEVAGNTCEKIAIDSAPPALLLGCGTVSVLAAAGSNERTLIEESERYGSGAGKAGLAAWSERPPGLPASSRIRTWSADAGSKLLVESMPGVACGVAVSSSRITGIRSGDPQQGTYCPGLLASPEFWSVPRNGGEVTSWRVPGAEPVAISGSTTWGEYAAIHTLTKVDPNLNHAQRSSIWLIRFTDGKMRRIVPSPGHDWRGSLLAIDETHLYVGEHKEREEGTSIDHVYRYRLDHFDEIGVPLE